MAGTAFSLVLPEVLTQLNDVKGKDGEKLVEGVKAYRLKGAGEDLRVNLKETFESRGFPNPTSIEIIESPIIDTWPEPNPYIELGAYSLSSQVSLSSKLLAICLGGGPTVLNEYLRAKNVKAELTWHCLDVENGRRCSVKNEMEGEMVGVIGRDVWEGGGTFIELGGGEGGG